MAKLKLTTKSLNNRIAIITSFITQLFYASRNDRISFRHIWDHILLLIQYPSTCFLFTKSEDGRYQEYHRISKDPRATHRFNQLIDQLLVDPRILNNCLFPVFEDAEWYQEEKKPLFYILIVAVYDFNGKGDDIRHMRPILNNPRLYQKKKWPDHLKALYKERYEPNASNLVRLISLFFSRKNSLATDSFQSLLLDSIARMKKEPNKKYRALGTLSGKQKLSIYRNVLLRNRFNIDKLIDRTLFYQDNSSIFSKINDRGYLDKVFLKVSDGLKNIYKHESNFGSVQANLSLFISDCVGIKPKGRAVKRCGHYAYGLSLHLFREQRKSLRKHFIKNLSNKEQFKNQYLLIPHEKQDIKERLNPRLFSELTFDLDQNAISADSLVRIKKFLSSADDWFWNQLKPDQNGYYNTNELFAHLEAPFGKEFLSVTDATFFNGIVHVTAPFLNGGGIFRCFGGEVNSAIPESLTKEQERDLRRICVTYYYYRSLMTPDMRMHLDEKSSRANKITIILVPIEVGGVIYAVSGHVAFIANDRHELIGSKDETWNRVVAIHNSVDQKVRSTLRRELKKLYLELVEHTFKYNCDELWKKVNEGKALPSEDIMDTLNKGMDVVEYLMPFDRVKLSISDTDEYIDSSGYHNKPIFPLLNEKLNIEVSLEKNTYFPRAISNDVKFLHPAEIADILGYRVIQIKYDWARYYGSNEEEQQ